MQVPEHLVSLYVATCGQNGPGLGSDEKEIILLVYFILDATTAQIIGTKQILVRPEGSFVKDRTVSTSSDTSNNASSPPLAITYIDVNSNKNGANNNNLNGNATITNATNTNSFNSQNSTNVSIINNNNSNNNNNININNNNTISTNGPIITSDTIELPIAVAQAAGKPLNEAIEEFDEYLRSLALSDVNDIKIITDGQLPLRQCLHREACAKDLDLPTYYNRFCDLRKEFLKHKSGDLSRALVPVKDIKKILQMPVISTPQSINEMIKELNIPSTESNEFYIRESRDMVSVIQHMLTTGHKFITNEIVNLVLEPGICSIDDEIDGNCIVRTRGLPWQSSDLDIAKFFRGLNVAKGGVALCLSPLGRRNGEALIRFVSQEHRDMALKRHKHHIGNRYIEVYRATGEDFLAIAGGASNEAQAFLSKGAQVIIRMRGLPYDCTAKQVLDFFTVGENPCHVLDSNEGVLFVKKPDGRATGDAFVLFASESDAPKALSRHRESIGQRYIELFRSTTAEVQQVLNRSMDPKTYETNHQPPLIAQLPPMQLSLLPQHLITSGTTKNCIRLRGLPYEALVEHILHFLDDFAKHILYQGVHMVINAQGQPSGEAFIQMDTEEAAHLCAQRKHNQFMMFGKKYRYIEVFQCSGDDMNMVLNGGLQSPVPAHHPHHPGGKQPSLLSPGMLAQPPPSNAQAISPHTHTHAHVQTHTHAHTHAQQLQSSPTVAAATMTALSQPAAHTHMPLSAAHAHIPLGAAHTQPAAMAAAAAAGSLNHFLAAAAAAPPTAHPTLQSAAVQVGGLASAPPQLPIHSVTATGASQQMPAMAFPFNFSLPPPPQSANSALIAQQQAQFIAQQNLLARQQAAAVAAEQQQQFFAYAAAATAPQAVAATTTPPGHPQFVFMPRQYFQPFPFSPFPPTQSPYSFASTGLPAATHTSATAAAAAAIPHTMKRSYEHAFQQDANATNAAKRALTRPPTGVYPFYNPGV